MPGVLKYTPSWLSRPSPGFDFFAPKASTKLTGDKSKDESHFGPLKSIAHRGTEVFVAVGNELRWSDLVLLKEKHDEAQDRKNGQEEMRDAEDDDELDGGGADAGEDKDGQSTYRVCIISEKYTRSSRLKNRLGPQSANIKTHQTTHYLARWRFPCNRNISHYTCRHSAGLFTSRLKR